MYKKKVSTRLGEIERVLSMVLEKPFKFVEKCDLFIEIKKFTNKTVSQDLKHWNYILISLMSTTSDK